MDPRPHATLHEEDEAAFSSSSRRYCCCFPFPSPWERIRSTTDPTTPRSSSGWRRAGSTAMAKAREWSELVAGPRWKTFIRRLSRKPSGNSGRHRRLGSFGYDPLSYALNFDGGDSGSPDRDSGYPDFSTRFVTPPAPSKSSMDLGGKDAPPLFAPPVVER